MNDRLVWIDCEMTGLDLAHDALIEVAVLVTDYELNVLGDGIDLVIAPPPAALEQMGDFVRDMHTASGLLDELADGIPLADAEQQVLDVHPRVREGAAQGRRSPATRSAPTATSWPATCRGLEAHLHYRIVDVSSIKELARRWYPRVYYATPGQERQPPRAGRHHREHRRAPLLPRGRVRAPARARHRHREGWRSDCHSRRTRHRDRG